jgi:hypothetical protein
MAFVAVLVGAIFGLVSSSIALLWLDFSLLASFGIFEVYGVAVACLVLLPKVLSCEDYSTIEMSANSV